MSAPSIDLTTTTNIMDGIPRPPKLSMQPSFSAPVSRVTTPPAPKKTRASSFSNPVSPIGKKKEPLSPIVRDLLSSASPTRAIKKRHTRCVFNKYNPRSPSHRALPHCPVHAYSTIEQELNAKANRAVARGVKFSSVPRTVDSDPQCPVHAYSSIDQELAVLPNRVITAGVKFSETPRDCLVPQRANCPVHVYAAAKTSLSHMGGATFATSKEGRDSYMATKRALAPVHAYETPRSSLRTAGGVAFGSTAPRDLTSSISRTGLLTATSTPRRSAADQTPPRLPKTLPRLVPLPEPLKLAMDKLVEEADDEGSPRDIAATLGMVGA